MLKQADPVTVDNITLSENMERIRRLVIPEEINVLAAEKDWFALAQRMAEISRCATMCSGICFSFHILKESEDAKRAIQRTSQASEEEVNKESNG